MLSLWKSELVGEGDVFSQDGGFASLNLATRERTRLSPPSWITNSEMRLGVKCEEQENVWTQSSRNGLT